MTGSESSQKEGTQTYSQLSLDKPAVYRIRIKGDLGVHWSDRMQGMQIRALPQSDGSIVTTLEGRIIDQAALFGVLVGLYNMRLPLISVECLDSSGESESSLMKVSIEQKTGYLEFIATGIHDAFNAHERMTTIINSCELAGVNKVLIDYRALTGGNRSTTVIEYANEMGQFYQQHLSVGGTTLRVAVVGKNEMIEPWKLSEEILRGYGLNALTTSNYEEATDWLTQETVNS